MIERNTFDNAIRDLALSYAPKEIARCGEVVIAQEGMWNQRHKVKITSVATEIVGIDLTIARRTELGITGWLAVQHEYFGQRLKANGELVGGSGLGILLTKFITDDGGKYERLPSSFNHVGLVFDIEEEV